MTAVRNPTRSTNLDRVSVGHEKVQEEATDAHREAQTSLTAEAMPSEISRADRSTVRGARSRAMSAGSAMQTALFSALPDKVSQEKFASGIAGALASLIANDPGGRIFLAGLDALVGHEPDVVGNDVGMSDLDPEAQKALVKELRDLGFELDDLSDPRAAEAIKAVKEYAGFPGTAELDFDFLVSMFMAKAQEERGGRGGAANYAKRQAAGGSPERMQVRRAAPVDTSNWSPGAGDVTPQQLQSIASQSGHSLSAARAAEVAPQLNLAMAEAGIDTPKKKSAFIAQLMHESGGFRFNEELASGSAYEGRRDLGNTQPGDGERFKGRGFIQLTGRANYEAAGRALGLDLVNNPELAATDGNAARVAAWYWNSRGLNTKAENGDFAGITRSINGGTNGAADRNRLYASALSVLENSHGLPSTEASLRRPSPPLGAARRPAE